MLTKKLFFDTNVCDLLSKPRNAAALSALQRHLFPRFRLVISPATLFELFDGLSRSDRLYFEKHQARFKMLALSSGLRCMPHPGAFVIKKVLGKPAPRPGFEPHNFSQWIKIVLAAKSYEDLTLGKVKLGGVKKGYGMDFLTFSAQTDEGKSEHARLLASVREGALSRPTPEQWACSILAMKGVRVPRPSRKEQLQFSNRPIFSIQPCGIWQERIRMTSFATRQTGLTRNSCTTWPIRLCTF